MDISSDKFIGAVGFVESTAPPPNEDICDEPYLFDADIYAYTFDPHVRLNGGF